MYINPKLTRFDINYMRLVVFTRRPIKHANETHNIRCAVLFMAQNNTMYRTQTRFFFGKFVLLYKRLLLVFKKNHISEW